MKNRDANPPAVECADRADAAILPRPRRRHPWVAFGVVTALLAVSAVGLNAAVGLMKLQFQKLPVPLAAPVESIPADLGPWRQVTLDRPIDAAVEEELGTKQYVFRTYVDTSKVDAAELDQFTGLDGDASERLAARMQAEHPDSVVRFALTYYTGSVDTVPHIPERCMVAGGFEPIDPQTLHWRVFPDRAGDAKDLGVRFIQFEQQLTGGGSAVGASTVPMDVAYFFQVNGGYESDPISGVRLKLQDLRVRHGYFAKIELATVGRDRAVAAAAMTDFLRHAMPAVTKVLPDWSKYESGTAPAAPATVAPTTDKAGPT